MSGTSSRQRVLRALQDAPGGLGLDELHAAGGHQATRRIRELRGEGWLIVQTGHGPASRYRLTGEPPTPRAGCARCGVVVGGLHTLTCPSGRRGLLVEPGETGPLRW